VAFSLVFTHEAEVDLRELEAAPALAKRLKAVRKTLAHLEKKPRHPSLQTHEFTSLSETFGTKVFEAYAEQNAPAAYRIFWHYGPGKRQITVVAITRHP
jgi:hypothetical protein